MLILVEITVAANKSCVFGQLIWMNMKKKKKEICTFESPVMRLHTYAGGRETTTEGLTPGVVSRVFDRATARDKSLLAGLGVTHVVNAADGPQHIDTGPRFYEDTGILYHGVEAPDSKEFDLSPFFAETADFIHGALRREGTNPQENTRNTNDEGCNKTV